MTLKTLLFVLFGIGSNIVEPPTPPQLPTPKVYVQAAIDESAHIQREGVRNIVFSENVYGEAGGGYVISSAKDIVITGVNMSFSNEFAQYLAHCYERGIPLQEAMDHWMESPDEHPTLPPSKKGK